MCVCVCVCVCVVREGACFQFQNYSVFSNIRGGIILHLRERETNTERRETTADLKLEEFAKLHSLPC